MWQVLLAAAVAGSGFFANRLLSSSNVTDEAAQPILIPQQAEQKCNHPEDPQRSGNSPPLHISTPPTLSDANYRNSETPCSTFEGGSVFRFSSSSGSRGGTGSRFGSKNPRKKLGSESRVIRRDVKGFENVVVGKVEKKCGSVDVGEGFVVDQRKSSGKRFAVCLKKRRTSRNATAKCESCCSSKDNSSFGWGLGVGIIYLMSTGKAEISRLNTAMDETAKVVQELKNELYKRKSSRDLRASGSNVEPVTNIKKIGGEHTEPELTKSTNNRRGNIVVHGLPVSDEGECASSGLTEEPQPDVLEMDQLEVELESELQKLPWCITEAASLEGRISDICKTEVSAGAFHEPDGQTSISCQFNGVLPSELDQKLCHVLIEQQESQIVELESELQRTHSKLHEKEVELQALKDCVKRLTEFSLASASDEEAENQVEEEKACNWDQDKEMEAESKRPLLVGMKRAMDFESYGCYTN